MSSSDEDQVPARPRALHRLAQRLQLGQTRHRREALLLFEHRRERQSGPVRPHLVQQVQVQPQRGAASGERVLQRPHGGQAQKPVRRRPTVSPWPQLARASSMNATPALELTFIGAIPVPSSSASACSQ